jgi:hypothetical protein
MGINIAKPMWIQSPSHHKHHYLGDSLEIKILMLLGNYLKNKTVLYLCL